MAAICLGLNVFTIGNSFSIDLHETTLWYFLNIKICERAHKSSCNIGNKKYHDLIWSNKIHKHVFMEIFFQISLFCVTIHARVLIFRVGRVMDYLVIHSALSAHLSHAQL